MVWVMVVSPAKQKTRLTDVTVNKMFLGMYVVFSVGKQRKLDLLYPQKTTSRGINSSSIHIVLDFTSEIKR